MSYTGLSDHWKGDEKDESEGFLAAILRIITTRLWLSRVNPFTSLLCRILRYHILHKGKQHCPKRRQSCFRSEESIFGLILQRLAPHVWGGVCEHACVRYSKLVMNNQGQCAVANAALGCAESLRITQTLGWSFTMGMTSCKCEWVRSHHRALPWVLFLPCPVQLKQRCIFCTPAVGQGGPDE